ncbi:hypothetical protein BH10BAC2_BH10BAC2_05390 [soil metagenome]
MKVLIQRIKNLAAWPVILFFLALTLLFSFVLFPAFTKEVKEITGKEMKSVEASLFPDAKKVTGTINMFKQQKVADVYIKTEIQKDLAFPFIYAILLSLLLGAVYLKWKITIKPGWIILIPFLTTVADLLENCMVIYMLRSAESLYGNASSVCAIANAIKFGSLFLCLGLLAVGLVWNLVVILSGSKKNLVK